MELTGVTTSTTFTTCYCRRLAFGAPNGLGMTTLVAVGASRTVPVTHKALNQIGV